MLLPSDRFLLITVDLSLDTLRRSGFRASRIQQKRPRSSISTRGFTFGPRGFRGVHAGVSRATTSPSAGFRVSQQCIIPSGNILEILSNGLGQSSMSASHVVSTTHDGDETFRGLMSERLDAIRFARSRIPTLREPSLQKIRADVDRKLLNRNN